MVAERRDGEVPVEVRAGKGRRSPQPSGSSSDGAETSRAGCTRIMPALGTFLLLAAFVACAYAIAASVAGARRRSSRLIESGIGAFYLVAALMTLASGVLVHAFVTNNYTIKYVQRYSDAALPLAYKIASYWGGLDGSIMFWVFLLSVFGAIAVHVNRERYRELIPWVVVGDRRHGDVLHLPDGGSQQSVLDLPDRRAG